MNKTLILLIIIIGLTWATIGSIYKGVKRILVSLFLLGISFFYCGPLYLLYLSYQYDHVDELRVTLCLLAVTWFGFGTKFIINTIKGIKF